MSLEQSEKVALRSIVFNALLTIMRYVLALVSGSVALTADAIHSLTDVISSVSVLAGIRLPKRRSKTFPYGLYKVENLVAFVMSLLIFVAGYEIVREAFTSHEPLVVTRIPWAMAGVATAIFATYFFSRYALRMGREINSPSIVANAEHIKTDMFSSLVIVVALIGGFFHLPYLDKTAALDNPYQREDEGKGIKVSEWLLKQGADMVFTRKSFEGKGPFYVFSNARVEMVATSAERLHELDFNTQD